MLVACIHLFFSSFKITWAVGSPDKNSLPALRTYPFVFDKPRIYALRVVSVVAGQHSQFITLDKVIKAYDACFVWIARFVLDDREFLQGRLWQPVAATSAVILTTFVHYDKKHHKKADSDHDGKGQEIGIDIKWLIIWYQEIHFRIAGIRKSFQKQVCNKETIEVKNSGC